MLQSRVYCPQRLSVVLVVAACLLGAGAPEQIRAETSVTIAYFDDALEPYGYWVNDPTYGRVWRPTGVPQDWGPYTHGSWVYTREYGWVWVSDEPYGWVVYHYGHWVWTDRWGWVWVAGYDWAPAWVEWCYGGGYVGWEPMPPDPYWQDAYYYGSYDCTSPAYYSHAVYVSTAYFGSTGTASHYEPRSRNQELALKASTNVTTYVRGNAGITNRGVDFRKLEADTGRTIHIPAVVQAKAPVASAPNGAMKELRIFRPKVAGLSALRLKQPHRPPVSLNGSKDLASPAASPLDAGNSGLIPDPLEGARDGPLGSGPQGPGVPDVGAMGRSLPSPGIGLGGGRGLLGR
jgi:Family of unknown function (DUF6600)